MRQISRAIRVAAAGMAACIWMFCVTGSARSETYPTKSVKLIVQTAAGSSIDVAARIVAEGLTRRWGQQVVVFNQPGAGGAIAARALASAPNDGYTLFFAASSVFVVLPEIQKSLTAEVGGFVPISFVGETPMAIAVSTKTPAGTIPPLLALAKNTQGGLNCAVSTRGGLSHLSAEALRKAANMDLSFVHYKGTADALTDVIAGRVPMIVDSISALMGPAAGGQIRILAVASPERLKILPDVPAMSEFVSGFEATAWFAIVAPAGTNPDIVKQIAQGVDSELRETSVTKRLEEIGTFTRNIPTEKLSSFVEAQKAKWAPVVRASGLEIR